MKRLFGVLVCVLMFCICLQGQNNAVRGFVKLQNSGSKALEGVELSGFDFNTAYSNSNGMFEIRATGKKPGDVIEIYAAKSGYEVVNASDLEKVVILNDPQPMTIIMCPQGQRNKAALDYYKIIVQNSQDQMEKKINSINAQVAALGEDDAQRDVLIKQIADLQKQNEDLKSQAKEMAQKFAGVDLDIASTMGADAIKKLNSGDVQGAISALNEEQMAKALEDAKAEKEKALSRLAETQKAVNDAIDNYMIKARLRIAVLDADSAYINYHKAVTEDTTNYDNVLEFARFVNRLNKKEETIRWFALALRQAQNAKDSILAQSELADAIFSNQQFNEAESAFLSTLKKIEQSSHEADQQWMTTRKAWVHRRLGDLYTTLRRADESRENLLTALKIYQSLGKEKLENETLLDYASAQRSLGVLYSVQNQFDKADSAYKQALVIYVELAKKDPDKYNSALAGIYRSIGGSYLNRSKLDSCIVYFSRAIKLFDELNEKSFHYYDFDLAYSEYGMALGYYYTGDYQKADSISGAALETYRQLTKHKATSFNVKVAQVLTLRGVIFTKMGQYDAAEKQYLECLDIYSPLYKTTPDAYRGSLADCYEGLSSVDIFLSRFAEAEQAARNGLAASPNKMTINTSLAAALLFQGKFDEAKAIYVEFKDKTYPRPGPTVTFADVFLEDLNALEEKGITHPDVDKARKLLNRS